MTVLAPETLVSDRYRLVARIAVGGMGEVWRAVDERLDRLVAVKVLKPEHVDDPVSLSRFRAEARHTAALSHPGIAGVFDYGEVLDAAGGPPVPYLVMELVEGEPLSQVLAREGRLPPERALDVVGQTGLALQAAHDAGVVHRDVKPGNLLLRPDGVVKVTDFGIARVTDSAPITQTGLVVGTAYYLSPEQAAGRTVTPASDVYSLGVVLHECLTGERPFTGENPLVVAMAHVNDPTPPLPDWLPASVRDLAESVMTKDPALRPTSATFGSAALRVRTEEYGRRAPTAAPEVAVPPAAVGAEPEYADGPALAEVAAAQAAGELPVPSPAAAAADRTLAMPDGAVRPTARTGGPGPGGPGPGGPGLADVGPATTEQAVAAARRSRRPHRSRRAWPVLVSVLAVTGVAGLGVRMLVGDEVEMPRVTALTESQARDELEAMGLRVGQAFVYDRPEAPGTVLAQRPAPGTVLDPDEQTVLITLSGGPRPVQVDPAAYVGRRYAPARDDLEELGLTVSREPGGEGPAGTVTAVEPSGAVRPGTAVVLRVAGAPGDGAGPGSGSDDADGDG